MKTKNIKKLFFENIGIKQAIFKNTIWLVFAEIISRILGLVLVIYVVRTLGATDYGKFTFAFSFATVMAILSDLGLSDISTREFSRNKENENNLSSILGLEIILCLFTFLVAIIASFFISPDLTIRSSVWILTLFVITNSIFGIIFSFLRARQKMEYEAGIKIMQAIINLFVILFVIFNIPSVVNLSYAYLASNIIILLITLVFFNYYFQKIRLRFNRSIFHFVKISWPLSFGFMMGWIYIAINSVMLGIFGLITENGWYNAASRIAIVAILPASLIVKSFYPTLSNFFESSKERLQKVWNYFIELMIILSVPIVIGGVALSGKITASLYGQEFEPSILALQLLMVVVGISFINYPYSIILVVADQQKKNFKLIFSGAILNVLLNFILVPIYGFYGAIISTIISCVVVFSFTVYLSRKLDLIIPLNKDLVKIAILAIISGIIMFLIINLDFINDLNIVFISFIGAVSYFVILIAAYSVFFPKRIKLFKNE